ncbi:hypothetical protein MLD38_001853 [Melastoma candidum]|uniref:Uncharacterized protein n=1 Tax=Melastoma candidum TaxID=119954 RepID=A0ACB9SEM5_9MYRT|nr:hypothetical protein MLD38_001853 [Melastoma candidum]
MRSDRRFSVFPPCTFWESFDFLLLELGKEIVEARNLGLCSFVFTVAGLWPIMELILAGFEDAASLVDSLLC